MPLPRLSPPAWKCARRKPRAKKYRAPARRCQTNGALMALAAGWANQCALDLVARARERTAQGLRITPPGKHQRSPVDCDGEVASRYAPPVVGLWNSLSNPR